MLVVVRRQIQKNLESTADLKTSCLELDNIDEQTISHALQKHQNMPSTVAAMKPLLSTKMKKKRLQKYKTWRVADWSEVMYSDGLTFCCIRATKRKARYTIPKKMP